MTIQEFKDNGYVYLKNALDKTSCENLTNYLKKLVNNKKTKKDDQCILSEAVQYDEQFEILLHQLTPYFEEKSGLKLYPTYSYARLYAPDDELKAHVDRPACEISVTITLGWEGNQWAIYMSDRSEINTDIELDSQYDGKIFVKNKSELMLEIGDAVMYRGMDKYHWREKFKGKWQAQVFLHYVDANGPNAEWKYDKRESLNIPKNLPTNFWNSYIAPKAISEAFCNKLIEEYSKKEVKKELPYINGLNNSKIIDLDIRNVQRLMLPLHGGVSATLTSIGLSVNNEFWKYYITHSNQTEFLMYDVDGKYEAHTDTVHKHSDETRKLTVITVLNNDFEGGKFFIQDTHEKFYPQQNKGDVIVFPSYMLHGVEPITKGIRYSVVTWLVGPYFK